MGTRHSVTLWYSVLMFMFWIGMSSILDVVGLIKVSIQMPNIEYKMLAVKDIICFYSAIVTYALTVLVLGYESFAKLSKYAKALNYFLLLLIACLVVYAFSGNRDMMKNIMRTELFFSIFFVVIPSILNIRALAKLEE